MRPGTRGPGRSGRNRGAIPRRPADNGPGRPRRRGRLGRRGGRGRGSLGGSFRGFGLGPDGPDPRIRQRRGLRRRAGSPGVLALEGSAMRRALAGEFACVGGFRVSSRSTPSWPTSPVPGKSSASARGAELTTFEQLAASSDLTILVAPESDGILLERTRSHRIGRRPVARVDLSAIALCGDKPLLGRWLRNRGIPIPSRPVLVRPSAAASPSDFPYPAVLKPVDGAGALDTFVIGRHDRSPERRGDRAIGLLQPLVTGEPWSAAVFVGSDRGARLVGFCRQRIEVRGGRFHYLGGSVPGAPEPPLDSFARPSPPSLGSGAGSGSTSSGTRQPVGSIQVLEINPRATTSFVGYRSLLPPGTLARAWIASMGIRRLRLEFGGPDPPVSGATAGRFRRRRADLGALGAATMTTLARPRHRRRESEGGPRHRPRPRAGRFALWKRPDLPADAIARPDRPLSGDSRASP